MTMVVAMNGARVVCAHGVWVIFCVLVASGLLGACSTEPPEQSVEQPAARTQALAAGTRLSFRLTELRTDAFSNGPKRVHFNITPFRPPLPDLVENLEAPGDFLLTCVPAQQDPTIRAIGCVPGVTMDLRQFEGVEPASLPPGVPPYPSPYRLNIALEEGRAVSFRATFAVMTQGLAVPWLSAETDFELLPGQTHTGCLEKPNSGGWRICWEASVETPYIPTAHVMPIDVDAADAELEVRQRKLIGAWIRKFAKVEGVPEEQHQFPPWNDSSQQALAMLAAGAAFFDQPELWSESTASLLEYASLRLELSGVPTTAGDHLGAWLARVNGQLLPSIQQHKDIGTDDSNKPCSWFLGELCGGDYDFTLLDSVALVYRFRHRPDLIPNSLVRRLLTHGQVEFSESGSSCQVVQGHLPFSGQSAKDRLTVGTVGKRYLVASGSKLGADYTAKIAVGETENHVLNMYAWRYLAQNYLEWVSQLEDEHPRKDPCLVSMYSSNLARYKNTPLLTRFVTLGLQRFLTNGAFETNAKPYEGVTLMPLLALASHADALFGRRGAA